MKKVIIRTREDELTRAMHRFGNQCSMQFLDSVESEEYGKDWCDCMYTSVCGKYSCWITLSKSGTVSACVFKDKEQ